MSAPELRHSRSQAATKRVDVRVTRALFDAIDQFAMGEPDKPGRDEAARRIIRRWLIANGHLPGNQS